MAEAAAHDASYLLWPTWPVEQRARMAAAVRPQADLLRQHAPLLHRTRARSDAVLFLPMRRWVETGRCVASELAAAMSRANVQFDVVCEDALLAAIGARSSATLGKGGDGNPHGARMPARVLVAESRAAFTPAELDAVERFVAAGGTLVTAERNDWLDQLQAAIRSPSITLQAPPTVRAVVRDARRATVIHLLNLNVQKLSSFEDRVTPASDLRLTCRVPFRAARRVRLFTADADGGAGELPFVSSRRAEQTVVELVVPKLHVAALLVIE
jgi:hypothetical protein